MTADASKTANAVVLVQRDADGNVTIRDAGGRVRRCKTAPDYAAAVNSILDDPNLPPLEDLPPGQAHVEEAVVGYARGLAPAPLRPFVGPMLRTLQGVLQKASDARRAPKSGRKNTRGRPRPPQKGRAA